jgi:hypothetical protein
VIPLTAGGNFLNRNENQNASVLSLVLPIPETASYVAVSDSGRPSNIVPRLFGEAAALLAVTGQRFQVDITLNVLHDVALIDRIE